MRKGRSLELQLDNLCKYINSIGYHAHKNNPSRTVDGKYLEGEPFDYEILIPGYHSFFDAKECSDFVWQMKPKDIRQAETLKHCKNAQADAFFLVYFIPLKQLIKIDIDDVIDILKQGHKSVPNTKGENWDLPEKIKLLKRSEQN